MNGRQHVRKGTIRDVLSGKKGWKIDNPTYPTCLQLFMSP